MKLWITLMMKYCVFAKMVMKLLHFDRCIFLKRLFRKVCFEYECISKNIIYSDISIVHPDYRGLGLQKKMGEWLFERIPEGYTIIMATVHPDNIASIKDKFHHDMHIIAKDFVYGDKVRYIFLKYRDERRKCGEEIAIHVDDVYKIERLLNEGFIAVDIRDNLLIFTK